MELPAEILIHNPTLGEKSRKGTLLLIHDQGYYEARVVFGEKQHRVLLPIAQTVIIARTPEEVFEADVEIER